MKHIFDTIEEYHMIGPSDHVLAAVSGGADSVCLLYVLLQYQKERQCPFLLTAVHVEHGLRGEESLEDARFTERLCRRLQVECRVVSAQVREKVKEGGLSVEEAARQERYRIFEEVREEVGATRIAVAHHQEDQAETVLWNLARGSGLAGLGGIRPVRGRIIRPLLFTKRTRIEALLTQAGLPWRTDRTNLDTDYTRNRIRHHVLPLLERELNSRAAEHIAQTAGRLQELQDFLDRMTEQAQQACIRQEKDSVRILLPEYEAQDPMIRQELMRRALSLCAGLKDIGAVHYEMLKRLAGMDCGRQMHLPGGIRAVRENGALLLRSGDSEGVSSGTPAGPHNGTRHFQPGDSENASERAPVCLQAGDELPVPAAGTLAVGKIRVTTELVENTPDLLQKIQEENKYTKWLSYDTIKSNIVLRTRRTGDYLVIHAQGGRKKLKDYFIDQKIPKEKRDRIWLLAEGSRILWVVGYRIGADVRVRTDTEQILKIQMEEEPE